MAQTAHDPLLSQEEKQKKTEEILGSMRAQSIEKEAAAKAAQSGHPYIDLNVFPIDEEMIFQIDEAEARAKHIVFFHKKETTCLFATTTPDDPETLALIKKFVEEREVTSELYVISKNSLEHAWTLYTHKRTLIENLGKVRVSLGSADLERFETNFKELLELHKNRKLNTSKAMGVILAGARKLRASDIHLEPGEMTVRLRYRVDGVLQEIGEFPIETYNLLLSRIKMISKMRLNIRKEAQDGHFFIELEKKRVDIRVNSIPGKFGESLNMRLLSGDDIISDIDHLGLQGFAYDIVIHSIEKPNGMILNTGPTGSGKTTTLYTLLHHLNKPDIKIITVEDPIEYNLPGIIQTEVSKDKSYTFATALRAVVRQDPDIVLVGEIRDNETADISVNAALTGHLVFSTLHANSAPAAIPRLLELGVHPSLISSSINLIIGQRLVRVLCNKCKESYNPAKETIDLILKFITIVSPKAKVTLPKKVETLWKTVGCLECNFTGYHGRVGIFEVFAITPTIVKIINEMGNEDDILRAALEDGMLTMVQDGILKALQGITTMEEVLRVTGQGDTLQNIYAELAPAGTTQAATLNAELCQKVLSHVASLEELAHFVLSLDTPDRLSALFAAATTLKAGDISIEPGKETFDVRFRMDGILKTIVSFPMTEYPSFLSETKLLAGLKSGERAGITDGRFSLHFEKPLTEGTSANIDVRFSIILGGFGETVVLQFLNRTSTTFDLAALSLRPENWKRIEKSLQKPNGLLLITGPSGSGKTTTLYTLLHHLSKPDVKIITVEDPIEYQMPGILQTQINEKEGYTFAAALPSLLRQHPDVLIIGDIRDDETARIALQAASTGNLVIATLYANSAAHIVQRLTRMGIQNEDLAEASNLFFAQRLVRRLCTDCAIATEPTEEESVIIKDVLSTLSKKVSFAAPAPLRLFREKGCTKCSGTGFTGQMMLSEALEINQEIQTLILHGAGASDIETKAVEEGMITILQDGIMAVLEGKTTLDEIKRVTEL